MMACAYENEAPEAVLMSRASPQRYALATSSTANVAAAAASVTSSLRADYLRRDAATDGYDASRKADAILRLAAR